MKQKTIANIVFIPTLVLGLFCLFYFPLKSKLVLYIFTGLFPLTIYYMYLVYFSKITYKAKIILEWIPLLIIAGTVGIISIILRIMMIIDGVWDDASFVDMGLLLLFLSIYGSIQAVALFRSKFVLEKNRIHFYSNITKTYDLDSIYAILHQDLGIIIFNSEKKYSEYNKSLNSLNKRINNSKNAIQSMKNTINLQDEVNKQYNFIMLIDFAKLSKELLRRKYQNKQELWVNPKYNNSKN